MTINLKKLEKMKKNSSFLTIILFFLLGSNIAISNQLQNFYYKINNDICSSSEDSSKNNCFKHCFDLVQDDVVNSANIKFIIFIKSDNKSKKKNKTDFFLNIPEKSQSPPF